MRGRLPSSVPLHADEDTESCASSGGSSSASSVSSSRSGRRRRSRSSASERRGGDNNNNNNHHHHQKKKKGVKNYADHVPMFPNLRSPTSILLEPCPNRRVRSMCIAGGMLVTAHRNGIRMYRQRYLSPTDMTPATNSSRSKLSGNTNSSDNNNNNNNNDDDSGDMHDVRTGLWEIVENRDSFQLHDAYLCVGAESIFLRERVLPLKWNRYLAVACGSDRTRFSVCVLSTAAHFLLHHELHGKNRVVALHFALVAIEAKLDSRRYQPFVVSIDEVGEVVVFDVEHDHAVKLTVSASEPVFSCTPVKEACMQRDYESSENSERDDAAARVSPRKQEKTIHGRRNDNDNNSSDNNNDNVVKVEDIAHEDVTPRLSGECPNENRLSPPPKSDAASAVDGGSSTNKDSSATRVYRLDAGLATNLSLLGPCPVYCRRCGGTPALPGTLLLSLYISSRAHGVEGEAELHVSHLRIRWRFFPPRAVVVGERPILREGAPEDVCDVGVAMLRLPAHEELPQSFTIARPRLRFWGLSGCAGTLLRLHRVYGDRDGSGKGARTLREHFVRAVPLGRQVLLQDVNTSWFCIAALTDDDVVLLLGREPRPSGHHTPARLHETECTASVALEEKGKNNETAEVDGRGALETWLDAVEKENEENKEIKKTSSPSLSAAATLERKVVNENPLEDSIRNNDPLLLPPSATSPSMFMDPNQDYTVLMILTGPGAFPAKTDVRSDRVSLPVRILLSVPHSNELLFFMDGDDDIYSIYLPFVRTVTPVKAAGKIPDTLKNNSKENSTSTAHGWMGTALNASQLLDMKIARPLISAMWSLGGEVKVDDAASLPPLTFLSSLPRREQKQTPQVPKELKEEKLQAPSSPSPSSSLPEKVDNDETLSQRSAVDVYIDGNINSNTRRKKRLNLGRSVATESGRITDDENDDVVRRAYIETERSKLLNTQRGDGSKVNDSELEKHEVYTTSYKQIISMDEPLQRNAIVYEWSDIHDNLYVQFIQKGHEIMEKMSKAKEAKIASNASFPSSFSKPGGAYYYESFRDSLTLSEFEKGDHSAGFMQALRDAQQKRSTRRDKRGIFNFTAYFLSGVVPQRLLDMQEDDRCRFELADLQAAYEDDIRKIHEIETVRVYENQQRGVDASGRRRWVQHNTFPYDDEHGDVIDMTALNNTATLKKINPGTSHAAAEQTTTSSSSSAAAAAAAGWRWANEPADCHSPRVGGSKLVRKELQAWRVGEWMYAARWPDRREELEGKFQWSAADDKGAARVRRRQLTRNRINVALEAAKNARRQEYERQREKLRKELDL